MTVEKLVDLQAIKYAAYCSTLTLDDACTVYSDYLRSNGKKIGWKDEFRAIYAILKYNFWRK